METHIFFGEEDYFAAALKVRHEVFSLEQGYDAALDYDEIDPKAWHIVVIDNQIPIATGRLYKKEDKECYGIGRIAVLPAYRKRKVGFLLMETLMDKARSLKEYPNICLSAQVGAKQFYEKLGYKAQGEVFFEENMPHIEMMYPLKKRGFEIAKGFEHIVLELPRRQTKRAAGYDFKLIEDIMILPGEVVLAKTGIKAYMLSDEVLKLYIRSSIAVKKKLWCVNNVGIIDADYYNNPANDGHIMIPLFNGGVEPVEILKGERVAQGIFEKYLTVECEDFSAIQQRQGGFGSTN